MFLIPIKVELFIKMVLIPSLNVDLHKMKIIPKNLSKAWEIVEKISLTHPQFCYR